MGLGYVFLAFRAGRNRLTGVSPVERMAEPSILRED